MKVHITITGENRGKPAGWPQEWPPPQEGQAVTLGDGATVYVRTVVWYPSGDEESGYLDPFVHVVLGPRRTA